MTERDPYTPPAADPAAEPERTRPGCLFRSFVWGGASLLLLRLSLEGAAGAFLRAKERTAQAGYVEGAVTAGALMGPLFAAFLVGLLALAKPARNERTLGLATLLILLFLNLGQCVLSVVRNVAVP